MGLDITAYIGITPVSDEIQARLDQADDKWDEAYEMNLVFPYTNPDFPEHTEGLDTDRAYLVETSLGFRAGSYGGYGAWRQVLAEEVANYPSLEAFWQAPDYSKPFAWLVSFSDCEGTISHLRCVKLAKDFNEYELAARNVKWDATMPNYFFQKYQEWQKAFNEIAAKGGFLVFH
jgi:hypothetical protein